MFLWKSDYFECAALLYFLVCLTLLASFFLPSTSFSNMYMYCLCYVPGI